MNPEVILNLIIKLSQINTGVGGKSITTIRQAIVLLGAYTKPGITRKEIRILCNNESMSGGSTPTIIKRYVAEGLLETEGKKVFLTEKGTELIERFEDEAENLLDILIT